MKVGDKFKLSDELCGHTGRVISMSEDGKVIYVRCEKEHLVDPFSKKPYGTTRNWKGGIFVEIPIKKKDIVYVIENP
jgi:hypothetical protein